MPKITELISFEGSLSNSDVFPVVNSSVTKKIPMSALRANVLTSGSVSSTMLQVDSVTTTKIANGNVTENKLGDGAVTNAKLANAAVNAAKIADNSITSAKFLNSSITEEKLATDAVSTSKILDLSVTNSKLASLSVSEDKLAANAVTTSKIANASVTLAKLAADAVFAAGTRLLFQQTSAPTGWTKVTGFNDRTLRVVDGNASSGGSTGFSSVFTSRTPAGSVSGSVTGSVSVSGVVGDTTLTVAQIPSHTHNMREGNCFRSAGGCEQNSGRGGSESTIQSGATGGSQPHNHSWTQTAGSFSGSMSASFSGSAMDFAVAYVDIIIAQKN